MMNEKTKNEKIMVDKEKWSKRRSGQKKMKNSNNFRYADDTTLMAEREEELKSLWKRVKEENQKWA